MLQHLLMPAKILTWHVRTWSELSFSATFTLLDKMVLLYLNNIKKEELVSEMESYTKIHACVQEE